MGRYGEWKLVSRQDDRRRRRTRQPAVGFRPFQNVPRKRIAVDPQPPVIDPVEPAPAR
ncbi:MAG TPA: hypothetical protein VF444_12685 [Pseudonocardiaceae bacterium]